MFKLKGVTLIELLISLAIIAIVMMAVAPSIQSILVKNKIVAELNELSAVIQFARNNAIDEQINTMVCPSTDYATCSTDWNEPKIVFIDADSNGNRGSTEELLAATGAISTTNYLTSSSDFLLFTALGEATQNSSLIFCFEEKQAEYARALYVTLQGRVKTSSDSDRNGVHEDLSGNALVCP